MQRLTKNEFKKMLVLSWERVESQKDAINKINVFPVPDQDTGTNIAKTLEGIKEAIATRQFDNLEQLKNETLEALLNSAQGNSGIIYAGFLIGLFEEIGQAAEIDADLMCRAFAKGAAKARSSISEPKEGTMLDVVDASAKAICEKKETNDFEVIFKEVIAKAKEALMATQEKMPLLKKAGVVDAGGLAFLVILESYYDVMAGNVVQEEKGIEEEASSEVKKFIQTLQEKYELVVLVEKVKMATDKIRDNLKNLGTSLDIVQIGDRVKIHIHTNEPKDVKIAISKIGDIVNIREEDLIKESTGQPSIVKQSIGLVVDVLSDLTPKIIERYQIEMVDLKWHWSLDKKVEGDNLYQKMRAAVDILNAQNSPKTSQPSPREFVDAFKRQLEKFKYVLYISFSKKMSGSYNSGVQAIELLPEADRSRVFVYDSQEASASQALMVLRAIELINSQFDINEIKSELDKIRDNKHVRIFGAIENPMWLEFGGRLSQSKAKLLRLLMKFKISPLLTIKNGLIQLGGFGFNQKCQSDLLFNKVEKEIKSAIKAGKKVRAVITHADNPEEAQKLKAKLKAENVEISFTNLIYPIIGSHVGPGSLLLGYMILD